MIAAPDLKPENVAGMVALLMVALWWGRALRTSEHGVEMWTPLDDGAWMHWAARSYDGEYFDSWLRALRRKWLL